MKHLFLVLLFLLLTIWIRAQSKTINGTLRDAQGEPAIAATIQLFRSLDSSFVKGSSSDLSGKFELRNLPNDIYYLKISGLVYKTYLSANLNLNNPPSQLDLPIIVLLPAKEIQLKEVVVTAKKPLIEQDIDKTIVNVDAMISAGTSNTLEVLEKTPGVLVDQNGGISLNGKQGVLVLIDGRATYMGGQDLAMYLKSLPGAVLDKIELMDNPPAKYDATGGAVINIKLKRNRSRGLTGNTSGNFSQGQTSRSYLGLNLNYNQPKINWFGNLWYSSDGNYVDDTFDRKLFSNTGKPNTQIHSRNYFENFSEGVNVKLGVDYSLSPKSTVGAQVFTQTRPREESSNYLTESFDVNSNLILNTNGTNQGAYDWLNHGINLNFTHKLNDKGRELSADANFLYYQSSGEKLFNNYQAEWPSTTFKNLLINEANIYNFKVDYVHPLPNKLLFEAGAKASMVTNDNNAGFENLLNGYYSIDYGRSNHFVYHENISAAYASVRKNWKRWGGQLGLRAENTYLLGDLLPNEALMGEQFTQNFTNVFPTVFLNYKLDSLGHHTLAFSGNARLNRPNYQNFNPFLVYIDNYYYSQGNVDLQPGTMYRAELSYKYKQLLNAGFSYNRARNFLNSTTELKDSIYITRPDNFKGKAQMLLLSLGLNLKPLKIWSLNTNLNIAHFTFRGQTYAETLDRTALVARGGITNQFTLPKAWSAELSAFWVSGELNAQNLSRWRYRVFAAVQKKIWKDMGSIKLSVEDLFHSWVLREETLAIRQTEQTRVNFSDTQRIGLAFSYRFGNEKWTRKRKTQDGAAEEAGRVN